MGFKFRTYWREIWREMTVVLLCGTALCRIACAQSRGINDTPEVHILVYDSARISARTLDRGWREVIRIFHVAGIEAVWINCSAHFAADKQACQVSSNTKQFIVHIIPKGKTSTDYVFGEAFIGEDGVGKYADIFFDRIEAMHTQCGIDTSQLLGAVAAHELGHLLLGAHAHSWSGLMSPVWRKGVLRHVDMGDLRFTTEQAVRLRRRIREGETRPASVKAQIQP